MQLNSGQCGFKRRRLIPNEWTFLKFNLLVKHFWHASLQKMDEGSQVFDGEKAMTWKRKIIVNDFEKN